MHPMPEFFEPSGNLFGWRVALRQGSFGQGNRSHRDYRGELGHIREHKMQIGRPLYEGLGRFAPLVNGTLLGVLELGNSL